MTRQKVCTQMDNFDTDSISFREKEQSLYEQFFVLEDLKPDGDDLKEYVESCDGGKWHDLEFETLEHFNCRHFKKWTLPSARAAKIVQVLKQPEEAIPSFSCMIIPADTSIARGNYIAQLTCSLNAYSKKELEDIKPLMHIGRQQTLFNADALKSDAKIIPVVEKPVSAMSIWQATRGAFPAVALANFGIRAATEKLLTAIDEIQPVDKRFLILIDGDPKGRVVATNLAIDLANKYVPYVVRFFDEFLADEDKKLCADANGKIDANGILHAKGNEFLKDLIARIADEAEKDFVLIEKEIAEAQAEAERTALTTEQYFALFQGDHSDKDFAQRMKYLFGDRVRWLKANRSWLIFERNEFGGGLWKDSGSDNSVLFPLAWDLSDRLEANANKSREFDKKLAKAFKTTDKFSATINMMKGIKSILIKPEDLNRHAELLNCLNGVVNLETGEFYPNVDPSKVMTKQANAVWRGKDFCNETVDEFLRSIQPNAETRAALLRYLGYGVTGLIRDHIFQIWRGDGRNGKSTLLILIIDTLGTYCVTLAKSAVLDNGKPDDPNAPTPALTVLEGARLAIVPELPRTARINTVLMKHLSAGDPLQIRPLHCEQRTIKPFAKYILNGNFIPTVDDVNDFGLNERIRNVPFSQTFTGDRADRKLPEKLATPEARSAMLSILVAEAQAWYRNGLLESEEMVAAKDAYINYNDFIGEFVNENCEFGGGFIELREFLEALRDNSDEARKTSERILKDMVKKWFVGKDGVTYKKSTDKDSRRFGFSGIHWNDAIIGTSTKKMPWEK